MSENQPETNLVEDAQKTLGNLGNSWQLKAGVAVLVVLLLGLLNFFWPHIVAEQGMKNWSASSGAQPISCVFKDTNDDQYISCSAILDEQIVPLECSSSIFNLGCRVTYGSAAPKLKKGA